MLVMSDSTDIIKGFVAGGQDYIVKPFNKTEVIVRVKTHIELKKAREKIKQFAMEMERKNKELKLLLKEVKQTAMTDFLTGVSNRRNAVIMMQEELSRINRNEKPFSLIIIDVDNFKKINDSYGHECGDYVLKRIAKLICSSLRKYDMLARWGGEEFLVMLPGTNLSNARTVVQKLILCVRNSPFNYKEFSFHVTITAGIAQYRNMENLDSLIKRADQAMYIGKKNGKDCAIFSHSSIYEDLIISQE